MPWDFFEPKQKTKNNDLAYRTDNQFY